MASLRRERRLRAIRDAFPTKGAAMEAELSEAVFRRMTKTELACLVKALELRQQYPDLSGAEFWHLLNGLGDLGEILNTVWSDWELLRRQEQKRLESGEESDELRDRKAERERREGQHRPQKGDSK